MQTAMLCMGASLLSPARNGLRRQQLKALNRCPQPLQLQAPRARRWQQTSRVRAIAAAAATLDNVEQIMTERPKLITCTPSATVDEALELLVEHRITGLPVLNEQGQVVGMVSDYDLLALEGITEETKGSLFPEQGTDWSTFFEVQKLIIKNAGKIVADVMTPEPVVVRPQTAIGDAAGMLLRMKIHRLPVVDKDGKLVGIVTRGDIIKAALQARKAAGR